MEKKLKILVTSALPYTNGPIHLGHIAGAYLPADIYVRFQRLLGNDVVYICGTDEHGVPITLTAEKEGVSPEEIVKRYHANIKSAFDRLQIEFDNFSGTSYIHNKFHSDISQEFFKRLFERGWIVPDTAKQHYCVPCGRFLADRFITGTCPKCGYLEARGDECSKCNAQFDPLELTLPKCARCGNTPEIRETEHWYLLLDKFQPILEKWIEEKTYWKENVRSFVKGWFKEGLKKRAVTRDLSWGIPVPLPEATGKVLYVWFDAPIGYISSTMEWAERKGNPDLWKDYWQNPETKIIHFLGKDNISFHAIIWPAMLIGQENGYNLPWNIPANEYLTFKQSKGSKSKGNAVWVHECLDAVSADAVRFYLAANSPEKSDTDFTWQEFQGKVNGELLGVLGNLVNRVLKFTEENFESKVPKAENLTQRDIEFLEKIRNTPARVEQCFSNFEVRAAISEIVGLGRAGNQYFDEKAPWSTKKKDHDDCARCLYVGAQLAHTLAVLLAPIIPDAANRLWNQLGHHGKILSWSEAGVEVPAGHSIGKPEPLFKKIEDDLITVLDQSLTKTLDKTKVDLPPLKEKIIDYEQFSDLDIRIGTILKAEKVKKADKLLLLNIDIGIETRQVVAGIAQYYTPESLIGKKIPILVNLKPAKIKGIESQGMILCASLDGRAVILNPHEDVPPGVIIR